MPNVKETEQLLNFVVDNPQDPRAGQVASKLGVDVPALEAWKAVKDNPSHPKRKDVRNKVFDQVAYAQPTKKEGIGSVISVGGADFVTRSIIKNFINESPAEIKRYLDKRGYQSRMKDGIVEVKKPGALEYERLDPKGFDIFDVTDLIGDVAEGLATGIGFFTGGAAGAVGGPVGAVAGAAAGGAAGAAGAEALRQQAGQVLGFRKHLEPGLVAKAGTFGMLGGGGAKAAGMGLKALGKGAGKIIGMTSGAKLKPNKEVIEEASKRLGLKPTPGQLIDSKALQELEEIARNQRDLFQTSAIRQQIERNQEIVKDVAESIVETSNTLSPMQVGADAKNSIAKEIDRLLAPAEEVYGAFEATLGKLPILSAERSLAMQGGKAISNPLEKTAESLMKKFRGDRDTVRLVANILEDSRSLENINDIKVFRTSIGGLIDSQSSSNKKRAVRELYKAVGDWRSESLVNAAQAAEKNGLVPKGLGEAAIEKLSEADQIYKSVMKTIEKTVLPRGKKLKLGPRETLQDYFEKHADSDFIFKTLKVGDPERIANIKKAFPEAFEMMKDVVVDDIASRSRVGISPVKQLLKRIDQLQPETKKLLFGDDALQKAEDLKVFLGSIADPREVGNVSKTGFMNRMINGSMITKIAPFVRQFIEEFAALGREVRRDLIANPLMAEDIFSKTGKAIDTAKSVGALQFGIDVPTQNEIRREKGAAFNIPRPLDFGRR